MHKVRHSHRKKQHQLSAKTSQGLNSLLFGLPILLTVIGIFFIFEASSVTAFRQLDDSFYYLKQQLMWGVLGVGMMTFLSKFNYRRFYYLAFPFLLLTLVLLTIVLIPGIGTTVYGARRWINLGFFSFQPTEFAKIAVILYISSWFLYKQRARFLHFMFILGLMIALIMIQPDLGTAILIFSLFVTLYFLSGGKLTYILGLIPIAGIGGIVLVVTSPYRLRRLMAFVNPASDPKGISYHINQILISLSSGGIFGKGFTNSRQKYQFLPEAHTDSIFAIIGEEVGFIGAILLIGIYIMLLYAVYKAALKAQDRFGYLLASGALIILGLQLVINLGGMIGVIPLTGVPLPFVSYGGSSLLVFYALMGIVINIAKGQKG